MALVIEDGSIVDGADSYISEAEYISWADSRFGASRVTAPADEAAAEPLILRAMDFFESLIFQGGKVSSDQPLQWPRQNVYIDGFLVGNDTIPSDAKKAVYELAYAEETGASGLAPKGRETKKEKVEGIEVEYFENSDPASNVAAKKAYSKLLTGYGGISVMRA